jgi:hypothetical protein
MMIRTIAALVIFYVTLINAHAGIASDLPPDRSPGATNPGVTQDNLAQTACKPNWDKTVRPPVSYTNKLKRAQMAALGLTGEPRSLEEDHRIPLICGGHPRSPLNLYPEPWVGPYGAHVKDVLESYEHRRLCRGEISLAECQAIFLAPHDWRDDYDRIYGPRGPH